MQDKHHLQAVDNFPGWEVIAEHGQYRLLMKAVNIPWLMLVPVAYPTADDELTHFNAACMIKNILSELFVGYQANIAKIGNVNPAYHIHIAFRQEGDALWPKPIWGFEDSLVADDTHLNAVKAFLAVSSQNEHENSAKLN